MPRRRRPPTSCATSTTREPRGREPAIVPAPLLSLATAVAATTPADVASALKLGLFAKLVLSIVLGGAVGLERELSGKPAGLRTNILICVGAALFMHLSITVAEMSISPVTGMPFGDTTRIAAQIVSGIGFLGAGTILQARGTVVGLTTAATIWVVAAIGATVGSGEYIEASGATVLVTIVLAGLGKLEKRLLSHRRVVSGTIRTRKGVPFDEVEQIFASAGITVLQKQVYEHADDRTFEVKLAGPTRQYDVVSAALMRRDDVYSAQFD